MSPHEKGIEEFRLWYRLHTGKMITRKNAEIAVYAYLNTYRSAGGASS